MNSFYQQLILEFNQNKTFRRICLLSLFFSIIFWSLSIFRHYLLHSNAYDLGLFDQWIWLASRGLPPYSTMTGLHLFADHGAWTLYRASLIYKFFPSLNILLLSQSLALCCTTIPLWFLCKNEEINDKNSFLISICWLLQPVVFNINLFDFHPEVWAMPMIVIFYLFEKNSNFKMCLLTAFLIIGTRDGLVLLIFGMGIEQVLKKKYNFSFCLISLSILWFLFLNNFAYPLLNGDKGTVMALSRYSSYGSSFSEIVFNLLSKPSLLISNVDWEGSIFYLLILFIPVFFLFNKLNLTNLLATVPLIITNILSENSAQRDLVHQYSLPISLIIIISLINGFNNNAFSIRSKYIYAWLIVCWAALAKPWFFTGPYLDRITLINSSKEAFSLIDKTSNILTTSYLVPHLSQRQFIKFPNDEKSVQKDLKEYDIILLNPLDPGWGSSSNIQLKYLEKAKAGNWECKKWKNGQEFCKKKKLFNN